MEWGIVSISTYEEFGMDESDRTNQAAQNTGLGVSRPLGHSPYGMEATCLELANKASKVPPSPPPKATPLK